MALTLSQNLQARINAMKGLGRGILELLNILQNIEDTTLVAALVAPADNGTNQTLTVAMVSGGVVTTHVTTGGATPSLTLPLASDLIAALGPNFVVGDAYELRIINTNSGTATIVTNTGWTTTGTLTLATNTTRDFIVTKTSPTTLSLVSVGTGTTS